MLYRSFMQKYRPLYSPDEPVAAASGDAGAAGGLASAPAAGDAPPTPAPADASAASVAAPATDAPAESAPKSEPTLLEAASGKKPEGDAAAGDKKDEPAPAEAAKPDADAKPEGDKPKDDAGKKEEAAKTDPETKDATADVPPAPIQYEAFKLPDGVKLDDKELGKFSEFAGKSQIPQDVAQGLIDMYVAERQNDVVQAQAEQRRVWDTLNDTWKTELRNDPELGGNRLETSLAMAKAVVEEYLPPGEQAEYLAHLRNNGMGNYKLHVKLLHNIGKAMNVFEDGIMPAPATPPKASKGPGNRGWYDQSQNKAS